MKKKLGFFYSSFPEDACLAEKINPVNDGIVTMNFLANGLVENFDFGYYNFEAEERAVV